VIFYQGTILSERIIANSLHKKGVGYQSKMHSRRARFALGPVYLATSPPGSVGALTLINLAAGGARSRMIITVPKLLRITEYSDGHIIL
jgi:hypothetical protein